MLNSRQANQIPNGKKVSGFAVFLCFVFIVWTGIFAWYGFKQYHLSGKLEEQMISLLVKHGGARAEEYETMQTWDFCSLLIKSSLSQTGTLSYLVRYQETIPKSGEKDIVKLASLFSGKKSDTALWCAAAGKKSLENDLFLQSDKTISKLLAAENKAEKKQKEDTVGNAEEETEELDTPEDELSVPTQSILLFQNGSPDITSQNKENDSGHTTSGDLLMDSSEKLAANINMIKELQKSYSRSYLLSKFYITDSSTSIDNQVFQVKKLLTTELKIKKESKPQILIFHTHGASEAFIDSKAGSQEDSIVGVGSVLAKILSEQYGYQVLHDKTEYDRINGKIDRNKAYNNAYKGLQKTLKEYPSIQVIIDLHRDGVGNAVQRITRVAGKRTAQVMFFNGLSRNSSGNIAYLHNDNLQGNLAFSLQLKIACMKRFENFAKPVYLKGYRYNMHLRKRFTLIELGNENNTVQEAKNAMPPLAMAIDAVLTGK